MGEKLKGEKNVYFPKKDASVWQRCTRNAAVHLSSSLLFSPHSPLAHGHIGTPRGQRKIVEDRERGMEAQKSYRKSVSFPGQANANLANVLSFTKTHKKTASTDELSSELRALREDVCFTICILNIFLLYYISKFS